MKIQKILFVVLGFLVLNSTIANADNHQLLKPIQEPKIDQVRLVDGFVYCYGRQGTQKTSFQIEGETIQSDGESNPNLPTFQPARNTYIGFGCVLKKIFIDFYLIDDSFRFDEEKLIANLIYNSIDFHQDVLSVGYSFTVIPHRFYLDFGTALAVTEYNLGRYGSEYSTEALSEKKKDQTWLIHGELKGFINHFIYIGWRYQQSINSDRFLRSTNQLGFNIIARF